MRIQTLVLAAALTFLMTMPAIAQNKYENKDTAVDRQDHRWGTRQTDNDAGGYHGETEGGNASWGNKVKPKEEELPPDNDIVIVVEPDVGYGSTSTETVTKDAAGDVTGSTTTTTTY